MSVVQPGFKHENFPRGAELHSPSTERGHVGNSGKHRDRSVWQQRPELRSFLPSCPSPLSSSILCLVREAERQHEAHSSHLGPRLNIPHVEEFRQKQNVTQMELRVGESQLVKLRLNTFSG